MTYRMTDKVLEAKVSIVNQYLGNDEDAGYSTPGVLTLSHAYGGVAVHMYVNDCGGVSDLTGGHGTKREAANFLDGMIQALRIVERAMTV